MRKKPALDGEDVERQLQIVHLADAADIIHRHKIDRIDEPRERTSRLPAKRFLPLPRYLAASSATPGG